MAIDLEDEILQDFLVEAGEILELLGEQLVELENSPEDHNLLNAIFIFCFGLSLKYTGP